MSTNINTSEEVKKTIEIVVVLGVVKDSDGKVMLTIRRETKLKQAHLKLQFPGGRPNGSEQLHQTAIRELREETGFLVKVKRKLPLVYTHDWDYGSHIQKTVIHCFECEIKGKSKTARKMHRDVIWHHKDEVDSLNLMPDVKHFLALL